MGELAGKRVLITGGAGGVGRAVVKRMAEQGARLLVTDRGQRQLDQLAAELASGQLHTVEADLARSDGVTRLFGQLDEKLGGIDLLVACAGVGSGPLMEMDELGWRHVIESNLTSYVACTQLAIERMRQAATGEAMIILVGSISVHIKAVGESVYNAAKGGVASFAETLRKEMMTEGIRVTLIEPGAIGSAMQPFSAEERERMMQENKLLRPDSVAEAIMFAATRPPGVDVVTLRIEPMIQKIY
ncbi:MAG TPA: SDR family oxidoreductase [Sphingomicrobium sp.]|nr:SDR family oxidoreductase [Sphingomicrobium sp.]